MKTISMAIMAAAMSLTAVPTAYAYDADARSDRRHIQRDRARLHADFTRLRDERGELRAAERRVDWAQRHGRFFQAWRAERQERREATDVRALEHKIDRDRADLARDRADLRRERRGW